MCGIFAYIGKRDVAAQTVLDGLKILEYRGYDSWGIAVKTGEKITSEKHVGKIGDAKTVLPKSSLGIGHTRWATHGGVTDTNAHPHLDCNKQIAIVHNGIVENNDALRSSLIKKGHKFVSETDTEVIAHLIEETAKKERDFPTAVRKSFLKLTGLNAVVVQNSTSSQIVAIKNGSPLIIGRGKEEFFLASDASAVIPHTKSVIFLEDNQMVVINGDILLYDSNTGAKIKPEFVELTWKAEAAEKGKYKHFLLKEINEQPHMIEGAILSNQEQAVRLATLIEKAKGTFMLGCGTASYAALAGTYLFSHIAKVHVNFSIGSEFEYLEDYLNSRSLVIPISQSGETIDVIDPVNKAKKKGAKIAAVVNVMGSTLYRAAHDKFMINAGPEKAVVSTKAFIAMYSLLLLTAYSLVNKTNEGKELLLKAAEDLRKILSKQEVIKKTAKKLKNAEHVFIIGRGLSYVGALEASLKLKETAYVHAEGFAGGELKHGVIALIEKGTPCIVLAPNDETYDEIISNAQQIKSRGGVIIGIGPKNSPTFDLFIETGDNKEATFISQIVSVQLLAYYTALERGIKDPDKPRNLAKSVTVK